MSARPSRRLLQPAQPALAAAARQSDLRLIRVALRAAGCRVRSARSLAETIRLAPRGRDGIVVLNFPNETFAVARRLRAASAATIVVFTECADRRFREAAAEAGVDAFLEQARAAETLPALLALFTRARSVRPAELDHVQQQNRRNES